MAPPYITIPPVKIPGKKRGIITLGSPATDSGLDDNGSDGGMGSDSEYEEIYKKVDLKDELNDLIEDQEYYHDFDSDLEPSEDAEDDVDDDVDDVNLIAHRDYFTERAYHEDDQEINGEDEESDVADFPLDYDSEYEISGSSPRKHQRKSPDNVELDIKHKWIEQPHQARIPDMSFKVNYDDDDVFEIPTMRLRKSSDAQESSIHFTELDLPVRSRRFDFIDLDDHDGSDGDVSDLDLDEDLKNFPALPETVTIRKPRRQHRRTISDHVPLGDGDAYLYTPPATKAPSRRRGHSIIDLDSPPSSTSSKRRSNSIEDSATPQSPTPTKRRKRTIEEIEPHLLTISTKRRSSSIKNIETPLAKRGRTSTAMPTPPNSSHTSPARRVHAPDGSPITAMRMGFTSALAAPATPQKQKDLRIVDGGDGFIVSSGRTQPLLEVGLTDEPEELLRSGRTPHEELNHLIANSGFSTGLRTQIKLSSSRNRNGWQDIRGNVSKPKKNRSVNQWLGDGKSFGVFEDETATMTRRVDGFRYRDAGAP